jgi:aspartyl-tRNA(Asn)/glutamyl-tRNA(Gln) amidotransferase subunit C
MSITRDDVLHVSKLARVRLEEHEIEAMIHDLGRIIAYVELLAELDTDGVEPTAQVAVDRAPPRDDVVRPSLDTETSLSQAPRRMNDGFAVPTFVDEG